MLANSNIKSVAIAAGLTGLLLWSVNNGSTPRKATRKKSSNLSDGRRRRRKSYKDADKISRLKTLSARINKFNFKGGKSNLSDGRRRRRKSYKDTDKIRRLRTLSARINKFNFKQGKKKARTRTSLRDREQPTLFSGHNLNDYMI